MYGARGILPVSARLDDLSGTGVEWVGDVFRAAAHPDVQPRTAMPVATCSFEYFF